MIRNTCLVLTMVALLAGTAFAQTSIAVGVEDLQCFVCRRTPADFVHIQEQALQQYDNQIRDLSIKIATIQKESALLYKRLSDATRGNANMALTVETVRTDVDTFRQIIPSVDELLQFYERYGRRLNLGSATRIKLSEVLSAMNNPDLPELSRAKRELEMVEVRTKTYQELSGGFLEFELFRVTTKLSNISAELANIEDLKKQYGGLLTRLLSQAGSEYRDAKNPTALVEVIEKARQQINADSKIPQKDKAQVYESFVTEFLGLGDIEYSFYLCPVCLTLFKNGAPSPKFTVWKFDRSRNRWDTTMHNFP